MEFLAGKFFQCDFNINPVRGLIWLHYPCVATRGRVRNTILLGTEVLETASFIGEQQAFPASPADEKDPFRQSLTHPPNTLSTQKKEKGEVL